MRKDLLFGVHRSDSAKKVSLSGVPHRAFLNEEVVFD
jgi:hypothetical protein